MFKNFFALLALKIAFKLLPKGYTVKLWKWSDDGKGNFQVFPCPNDGNYLDVLYSYHN